MRIRDYVTGRALAWLTIATLGTALGISRADAQTNPYLACMDSSAYLGHCATSSDASAGVTAYLAAHPESPTSSTEWCGPYHRPESTRLTAHVSDKGRCASNSYSYGAHTVRTYDQLCAAGSTWNPTTNTCGDPPPTEEECLALNGQDRFDPSAVRVFEHAAGASSNTYCPSSGCAFVRTGSLGTTCVAGQCITRGSWNYSGASCSTDSAAPDFSPPPPVDLTDPAAATENAEACQQVEGQTLCVKGNGDHCYSLPSSPGAKGCWTPGEVGLKTHGADAQKRNAGDTPIPPVVTSLPSGDTLAPNGNPITTTTTTTTNNTTTNTTTTTTNYTTQHGTDAGPSNQGDPDGPEGPADSDGDGKEDGKDEGSVTGGDTCAAPPVCSGPALLCGVILQTYLVRCAAQGQWDEVLDMPFDERMGYEDLNLASVFVDEAASTETLDTSGFGWGRSCPAPPEFFGTVLDLTAFCGIMQMIGLIVLAMGALHSVYAMRGGTA